MSTDDGQSEPDEEGLDVTDGDGSVRGRLGAESDRAAERFDDGMVDLLSWVLDTETRARIYVTLRQHPDSTSDEVADGTGLYPSTVREALAELHDEGTVARSKRESDGAGSNPYEYTAIAPSELVSRIAGDVQSELNTVCNLDDYLGGEEGENGENNGEGPDGSTDEPVTITVEESAQ